MNRLQRGQVLPLGLVLVVIGMVAAFTVYNTGLLATEKMKLANSADAAAYSGALWQARALNYQAYANRAMIANQVAIGQAVSIQSWMTYAAVTADQIATLLKPVPVLNVITSGIQTGVAAAETAISIGTKAMVIASSAVTKLLSVSQTAMIGATLYNTWEIISTVASETDARFTTNSDYGVLGKSLNSTEWWAFNKQYKKRDRQAMNERHELIMASRDSFTKRRNWDLFSFWVPTGWRTVAKLRRQGTTHLVAVDTPNGVESEWVAKDTLSVHTKKFRLTGSKRAELPIAWGSAFTNSKGSTRPIKRHACGFPALFGYGSRKNCVRFTDNELTEEFADINFRSLAWRQSRKPISGYGGVQPFWVLNDKTRTMDDARLKLRVEVSLPAAEVRESNRVAQADQLSTPMVIAGKSLSSLSAADVFYRHPKHHAMSPGSREKHNAYNPYWQAALAPISKVDRLAALARRSGGKAPTQQTQSAGTTRNASGPAGQSANQGRGQR